jgi:hypothetical protein
MEGFREIDAVIGSYVLPLLLLFWAGVSFLISRISGWSLLARHYRMADSFDGKRWRFQTCQMRWMTSYRNTLIIGGDRRGLHLSVLFLFRPGHPSLFVPWGDISAETRAAGPLSIVEFRFRKAPETFLRVMETLGSEVLNTRGSLQQDITRTISRGERGR